MGLRKVRVPPELQARFEQVERLVSRYFEQREESPEQGTIEILGERYVLVRGASLSVEFFSLVRELFGEGREAEADDFARNILFDLAHSIGKSDACRLHERMELEDPIERLAAGPVHFAHTGWAFVDILPGSDPGGDEYYLLYDHPYSFEADAWLRAGKGAGYPVCIMNAGYSSGWSEESYEKPLVASEVLCRAKGDDTCRFIMASPERIESHVERYIEGQPHLAPRMRSYQVPDFFARKRMEEELRKARDELEQRVEERTAELRRANDQLKREMAVRQQVERKLGQIQKLEAIGRLAGGIAHDFNNLMGVVIGQARMLEKRMPGDSPEVRQVAEIREAGERASDLTRQLLAFGRAQVLTREHIALNGIVSEVAKMLQRLIGEDIELVTRLGGDVGYVAIGRGQMTQVLLNLAVNARDAMTAGGRLIIETKALEVQRDGSHALAAGSWCVLSVSDNGVGMDERTRSRLFDPFFTTKGAGEGTGLGLSTVYGIVTQSGGQITVDSAPGRGATFHIHLPKADPPPRPVDERIVDAEAPPRGNETILVVEDQAALLRMVAAILEDLGYRVLAANHPDEALRLAANHPGPVHLLVSDVVMPKMSGRELAEWLLRQRPQMRVLYVSGYANDETLRYGVQQGSAELLQKPFTPELLAHRVRAVLDGR